MGLRMKRPIIWVTIAYIVGILMALYSKWGFGSIYIALMLLALAAGLARLKWKGLDLSLFLSLFALIGMANAYVHTIPNTDLDAFVGQASTIYGQILEITNQTESKTSFTIKTHRLNHSGRQYASKNKIRATIYLNTKPNGNIHINPGDWIEIKGEIEKPQGLRNPKGFDYQAYLARHGIHYVMGEPSKNIVFINRGRFPWPKSWLNSVRSYISRTFDTYVGGTASTLMKTMIIGEKWTLPSAIKEQFSSTGIAHILAISGLHIGFVILLLSWLTSSLRLLPRSTFLIQGIALGFYCLVVGGNPPIVRATIMTMILLGGRVVGRKADPLNSLFLAAFAILIFNPLDLLEIGFQLSFGAVAGIVLYNESIRCKLDKVPKIIVDSIAIMLAAQLGTWALIAYHFNTFSPISFIANLVLVPIAGAIVILGIILPLMAAVLPIIANVLGWWLWILCSLLIDGNRWLSSFPWSNLRVISPGIFFIMAYYAILLFLSEERPKWVRKPLPLSGILALVILLSIVAKPILDSDLKVVFVDVGQGDCIYIKTPDEKHILVDGGGRPAGMGDFDVGAEIVVPFLLKNGVNRLDLVAMSHAHDDHMGGLIPVVKDLKVDAFMEFPPREHSEKYRTLNEWIDKKGIRYIQAIGGQTYKIGKDVFLDIIYPSSDAKVLDRLYEQNENNLSLVMRIRYRDTSIMLTGDIEQGVESYLSGIWDQEIAVLKVAHHGSKTSSTEEWINIINPRIAIIQSGKNNFGHPDSSVLQRLENRGTKVFRNDMCGAITCVYKKGKWRINTMIKD